MQRKYKTTIIILLVTSATMQIIRQYQRNDMIAGPLIEKLPLMTLFENIPLCITRKHTVSLYFALEHANLQPENCMKFYGPRRSYVEKRSGHRPYDK